MSLLLSESQLGQFRRTGVIAVMVVDDPDRAVRLAKALLDGGVDIMELTLRTPQALACLAAIVKQVPEMLAGAGTILFPEQVDQVVQAGAAFGVAPGTNPVVIRRADQLNLPFAPGVATPTDIDIAVQAGCRLLSFSPQNTAVVCTCLPASKPPMRISDCNTFPLAA